MSVEDWAEIRRLHRTEGLPIKMIARMLGVSRNTVRAALASDSPPKYVRKPAGSAVDAFEPRIRELLQAFPTMPATVIAERVGWDRGMTVFKERVRELRPVVPPESWRASLCGFPVGGRGVLVVDRAHHARRAVPALVVVEPVASVQHDGLGLAGVLEAVA